MIFLNVRLLLSQYNCFLLLLHFPNMTLSCGSTRFSHYKHWNSIIQWNIQSWFLNCFWHASCVLNCFWHASWPCHLLDMWTLNHVGLWKRKRWKWFRWEKMRNIPSLSGLHYLHIHSCDLPSQLIKIEFVKV